MITPSMDKKEFNEINDIERIVLMGLVCERSFTMHYKEQKHLIDGAIRIPYDQNWYGRTISENFKMVFGVSKD